MKSLILFTLSLSFLTTCTKQEKQKVTESTQKIELADAWARPSKAGMMSAAYFTIKNGLTTADTLLSASSDASPNTQIHLSFKTEDGLMAMEEQAFVAVPAQAEVEFKQGGLHIMIIQPIKELAEGDSISLTLSFSSSLELQTKVPIKGMN